MATRKSVGEHIQRCEEAIEYAKEQFIEGSRQEHYYDNEYQIALQELESSYNDLTQLANSSNSQQREQLHRMRLQLQQVQNQMILLNHDRPM
ncbi:YtzC family protein [Heyndrickxia sp. NPDC080065]|uniref:YtzC family protein n=1 Tax=Heyndrickxia sp. NPDC080065 TaxID=3390568 RepID=UPI003CFFDF77